MNGKTPPPRSLYAAERQDAIVREARNSGRVEVSLASEKLGVTPETVRRDLTVLEQRGLLRRVHGGALPVMQTEREPNILTRLQHGEAEKNLIAQRAIQELPSQGSILLDSGTTTLALARILPADLGLSVVTNSIHIAAVLANRKDIDLHLLGGKIREVTGAAVGSWALGALHDTQVDAAFLGANGFSVDHGVTTPDLAEADVKRAMVACARRPIVLAESSKAGRIQFQRFARIDDIAMLITDSNLDDETAEDLDAEGMEVVRA